MNTHDEKYKNNKQQLKHKHFNYYVNNKVECEKYMDFLNASYPYCFGYEESEKYLKLRCVDDKSFNIDYIKYLACSSFDKLK